MKNMGKLNAKAAGVAAGIAAGIVCGVSIFVVTLISVYTGYATPLLNMISSIYPGYSISAVGSIIGLIYGFLDGFITFGIGFYIGVSIYNRFEKKT